MRELYGLVLYRLGRFDAAMAELEFFRELSGSVEQHPVLADCHRALGRWADVEALWKRVGRGVPVGRAGDRGTPRAGRRQGRQVGSCPRPSGCWSTAGGCRRVPGLHHLRRAYALADLYERAGRPPRARELFRWVESHDPRLADVSQRVLALS